MTEKVREMMRQNYASQLEGLGYGPDGMALPKKQKQETQWISVKDIMPELHHITSYSRYETVEYDISDPVLVATYEGVFIARYEVDNDTAQYWIDSINEKIMVTHWMPLPEPPKE